MPISLRSDVDDDWGTSILSEEVLKVLEGPVLQRGVLRLEEVSHSRGASAVLCDCQVEVLIGLSAVVSFGTIQRSVDFDSDVESLACKEVGTVRREDAAELDILNKSNRNGNTVNSGKERNAAMVIQRQLSASATLCILVDSNDIALSIQRERSTLTVGHVPRRWKV